MKGCFYEIGNKRFNSEIELDDFLVANQKYIKDDTVFSRTTSQNHIHSILSSKLADSKELKSKYYKAPKEFINEEEVRIFERPYIGVNLFLQGRKSQKHGLFTPEFIEDNYWSERFKQWKSAKQGDPDNVYTEDEVNLFFEGDRSKAVPLEGKMAIDKKNEMTTKWTKQARMGDAVHEILQTYFKYDSKYNKPFGDTITKEEFKDYVLKNAINRKTGYIFDSVIDNAWNIAQKIKASFPEDSMFYPEYIVTGKLNQSVDTKKGSSDTLLGMIDLLVIDPQGNVHIIDYKTSPKPYGKWNMAKKRAYQYQTAIYRRLLQKYGIIFNSDSTVRILPILIRNLRKEKDEFVYDGCKVEGNEKTMWSDISGVDSLGVLFSNVQENLDEFIYYDAPTDITFEKVSSQVSEVLKKWFPSHNFNKNKSRDEVITELERMKALEPIDGQYIYKPENSTMKPIKADSPQKLVDAVLAFKQRLTNSRVEQTQQVKRALKQAFSDNSSVLNFKTSNRVTSGSTGWFNEYFTPYLKGDWEIISDDIAEQFGIILLKNIHSKQYDVIKISTEFNLLDGLKENGQHLLTFGHQSDLVESSKSNSLMLEYSNGNIELMEAMLVLNQALNLYGDNMVIGKIQVMNPIIQKGVSASNEELYYTFDQMSRLNDSTKLEKNQFKEKNVSFINSYTQVLNTFQEIMLKAEQSQYKNEYINFKELSVSELDAHVDSSAEQKIKALMKLLKQMEKYWPSLSKISTDQSFNNKPHVYLYNQISQAILDLSQITPQQQLKDVQQYFEGNVLQMAGTHLDNPGMLSSKSLNTLTSLIMQAYQNVRDSLKSPIAEQRRLIQNLKDERNFGWLKERTVGNQVNLYKNMIEFRDGDVFAKNPWKDNVDLSIAERDYLKFFLTTINQHRLSPDNNFEQMIREDNPEFFKLPLMRANYQSIVSQKGIMDALIDKLKGWMPKEIVKRAREESLGIFDDKTEQISTGELFDIHNRFAKSNSIHRQEVIDALTEGNKSLESVINTDLEWLLLSHTYSYTEQQELNQVFPLIKAISIGIQNIEFSQNQRYTNTQKYIEDYILSSIKKESISGHPKAEAILGKLRAASSFMVLAASPLQVTYQSLQSLWNDIKLIVQNPVLNIDGEKIFTIKNLRKASALVYGDLFKGSNTVTISSGLNETYALNDMDNYERGVASNRNGIFNIERLAMKFTSRPDYYSRLKIFNTFMESDGCLDAHSIQDRKLKYDWTKDKRFDKFARNPNSKDPEVARQRALYVAMCKQFERENTKNEDGTSFVFKSEYLNKPIALPRAYTTKQAENIKAIADQIYGYYSKEKKSLIHATLLGAMFMQFKTYWSGKKNQYLQKGGVKLQGKFVQAKDKEGNDLYYKINPDGSISEEETTEVTEVPVIKWEGQWQEGIFVTMWDMAKEFYNSKSFMEAWNSKWNNSDPRLQQIYRANFRAFAYDLFIMIFMGGLMAGAMTDWVKELNKDSDKDDLSEQLKISAAKLAVMSLEHSFLDFNFIDSAGKPVVQWTPMSFDYTIRTLQRAMGIMAGDNDVWDGVLNSFSATKQFKNTLDVFKPDMFKTPSEGGTFGE